MTFKTAPSPATWMAAAPLFLNDRIRVLLVDDDPIFAMTAEARFQKAGFIVTRVGDGAIAKFLLESEPLDAVVTDLEMPFLSGDELIQSLHAELTGRDIPIFVVTADPDLRLKSCLGANVQLWMNKPVDWSFLVSEVRDTVATRRSRRATA